MHPFDIDFDGSLFLALQMSLLAAATIAAHAWRRHLRDVPQPRTVRDSDLSPTDIGYLIGGVSRALHAALAGLHRDGRVVVVREARKKRMRFSSPSDELPRDPFERELVEAGDDVVGPSGPAQI